MACINETAKLLMYYSLRIHSLHHIICRRGTEEEYSELMQLLEDISSYMGDLATLQKKVRDSKNKDDKQKAKEIKAVMEKLLVASMLCGALLVIAVCMECIIITSWCKVVYRNVYSSLKFYINFFISFYIII